MKRGDILSKDGLVVVLLARDPDVALEDLAIELGVTRNELRSIVANLVRLGVVRRTARGHRVRHAVDLATVVPESNDPGATIARVLRAIDAPISPLLTEVVEPSAQRLRPPADPSAGADRR